MQSGRRPKSAPLRGRRPCGGGDQPHALALPPWSAAGEPEAPACPGDCTPCLNPVSSFLFVGFQGSVWLGLACFAFVSFRFFWLCFFPFTKGGGRGPGWWRGKGADGHLWCNTAIKRNLFAAPENPRASPAGEESAQRMKARVGGSGCREVKSRAGRTKETVGGSVVGKRRGVGKAGGSPSPEAQPRLRTLAAAMSGRD